MLIFWVVTKKLAGIPPWRLLPKKRHNINLHICIGTRIGTSDQRFVSHLFAYKLIQTLTSDVLRYIRNLRVLCSAFHISSWNHNALFIYVWARPGLGQLLSWRWQIDFLDQAWPTRVSIVSRNVTLPPREVCHFFGPVLANRVLIPESE